MTWSIAAYSEIFALPCLRGHRQRGPFRCRIPFPRTWKRGLTNFFFNEEKGKCGVSERREMSNIRGQRCHHCCYLACLVSIVPGRCIASQSTFVIAALHIAGKQQYKFCFITLRPKGAMPSRLVCKGAYLQYRNEFLVARRWTQANFPLV